MKKGRLAKKKHSPLELIKLIGLKSKSISSKFSTKLVPFDYTHRIYVSCIYMSIGQN